MCPHTPVCPPACAPAAAARIVVDHLQDCGYALLCNGAVLLEGEGLLDGLLDVPGQRSRGLAASAR